MSSHSRTFETGIGSSRSLAVSMSDRCKTSRYS